MILDWSIFKKPEEKKKELDFSVFKPPKEEKETLDWSSFKPPEENKPILGIGAKTTVGISLPETKLTKANKLGVLGKSYIPQPSLTVQDVQPKSFEELMRYTKASHENELDLKKIITDSAKFSLQYTYSRLPERSIYGVVNTVARIYAYGFKKVGLTGMAKPFEDIANYFKNPPVTGKVNQKIAEMDEYFKGQGSLKSGAFKMTMAAIEAVSFIERIGLTTDILGISPTTTKPGIAKGILGKIFTGTGTKAEMAKRALTIGGMAATETPGDIKTKFGSAIYGIANYMTGFIANATGAVGWTAVATDTMLNAALDMPTFIKDLKNAKNPGEFLVQAMPMMASWIIFALDTRGTEINQRIKFMDSKSPDFAKLPKEEKVTFINKLDMEVSKGTATIPVTEKTAVTEPVKVKTEPEKVTEKGLIPIEGTGELKTRGLALSVEAQAIANKLSEGFEGLPQYKTLDFGEQSKAVINIRDSNYELAKKMALGQEQVPKGILPEAMFKAVESRATKEGDISLIMDLANQSTLTTEATVMGQRIAYLGQTDPLSPVKVIQDINKILEETVTKKQPNKSLETTKNKIINEDKTAINNEVNKSNTKFSWEQFIRSIQCP